MCNSRAIVILAVVIGCMFVASRSAHGQCTYDWKHDDGLPGFNGSVYAAKSWDPDGGGPQSSMLVVGGSFEFAGNVEAQHIALRSGTSWQPIGNGVNRAVIAIAEYQGDLIAGGDFTIAGDVAVKAIARWDGSEWRTLGDLFWPSPFTDTVTCMTEFNGDLIVGGIFSIPNDNDHYSIARWNGVNWYPLGLDAFNAVNAMAIFEGKLIVGGYILINKDPYPCSVASWNGAEWQPVGTSNGEVYALTVFNGELIAGGNFTSIDGTAAWTLARWNGTTWRSLAGSISGTNASVFGLTVFNNELIVGGHFDTVLGALYNNVARWNGTTWSSLAQGIQGMGETVYTLGVHDGEVIAGGDFTSAGSTVSAYLARYGPTGPAPTITQHPASPAVCQGSAISLRSIATGDGALSYQWRKSGTDLIDDEDTFGTQNNTLVFAHAAASDAGSYDCLVKLNDCTQATSNTATLAVFPTNTADGNLDGLTDGRDIAILAGALTNFAPVSAPLCAFDLTGEGIVNTADISPFVVRLLDE